MIVSRRGTVSRILSEAAGMQEVEVDSGGETRRAVAYTQLTGGVAPGDEVLLNTTAVELNLGSGGVDFVMAKVGAGDRSLAPGGHILRLNYTPMQCRVMSVEEPDGPHRAAVEAFNSLEGTPVVAGTLHSMAAPLCAVIARLTGGKGRVAYVMSDGACLPLAFSRTVRGLKEKGLIAGTVTYGNAFGGDIEAVNKFSALAAARAVLKADFIVVCMGVGSIGTASRLGFSGMEQGEILNAARALGGEAIACVRVNFGDARERHRGISHHTLTAMSVAAQPGATLPLPLLEGEKMEVLREQVRNAGLEERHRVREIEVGTVFETMDGYGLKVETMGRGVGEVPEFFLACEAAAAAAVESGW
ncbi:MAG: DUF3866 family protein [bacterium]